MKLIFDKSIFTLDWLKAALVRALRTFAQTAIAGIGTVAATMGEINWINVLSCATLAAVLSVLTSVAGLPETSESRE
jgi:hypothetical protein